MSTLNRYYSLSIISLDNVVGNSKVGKRRDEVRLGWAGRLLAGVRITSDSSSEINVKVVLSPGQVSRATLEMTRGKM